MNATAESTPAEFTRLERETPWGMEIGCSLLTAITFLGIATFLWVLGSSNEGMSGLQKTFVAGLAGVGLLALLLVLHQSIARRVPETIVEVASPPIRTGVPTPIRIVQPGPVRLRALRAKAVWLESDSESGRQIVLEETFLDRKALNIADTWETTAELRLPENAQPTGRSGGKKHEWRIEIWGNVRFFPNFMHPFTVRVKRPDDVA